MSNLFSKQSPWGRRSAAIGSILFVSAMFAACGDEVTEVTKVTQVVGMQMVEEGDALPECTADSEGAMAYSVDSAEAYTCIGGTWTPIKGKDGKDGADGKNGKDGKNGANGAAGAAGSAGADGKDGSSCTVKALKDGNGYKIVCGGDSVGVVLNGEDGQDGAKGDPGAKGDSGATGKDGLSAYEIAKAGGYEGSVEEWIASLKGNTGAKGDSGKAGTSCSAVEVSDGVEITCTDGKSVKLRNGADGKDVNGSEFGWMVDSRDRQFYRIVTIGKQTWMAENLNYKFGFGRCGGGDPDGDYYNVGDCSKYGRIYEWAEAIDKPEECAFRKTCVLSGRVRGLCPEGWHLPDSAEVEELFTAVGGESVAGKMLKAQTGWNRYYGDGDANGTDAYGFSALPAGMRADGHFAHSGYYTEFWTITQYNTEHAYSMGFSGHEDSASLGIFGKDREISVRCLKD